MSKGVKEKLKNYTSPKRSKKFYENHKKEIGYGEYKGVEHSSRFKQLLYRATAEEIISMSKAASLSNIKLAQFRDEFMAI